jgi:zona occludens toxin (predicted ATPase)
VAARTPGENSSIRTPATAQAAQKTKAQKAEAKRRRDPMAVRRKQSIFPYIVLFGGLTYGVWFYGSKQPAGTGANDAALQIAAMASSAKAMFDNFTGKKADSTAVAAPVAAPAPVARKAKRTVVSDTTTTATAPADSAPKKSSADSASTTTPPPDSARQP